MDTNYEGPERRDSSAIGVLIARLEVKFDSLQAIIVEHIRTSDARREDHEIRLRQVESSMHDLATRKDIEEIEQRREKDMEIRQRKIIAGTAAAITLFVPFLTYIMQQVKF
jgi:hypothetical protein